MKVLHQHVLTGLVSSCMWCMATIPLVSTTFGMRRCAITLWKTQRAVETLSCPYLGVSWDRMMRYVSQPMEGNLKV